MEILAVAALFRLLGHFQQRAGLLFGMPGIKDSASGDQQIGSRLIEEFLPHRLRQAETAPVLIDGQASGGATKRWFGDS